MKLRFAILLTWFAASATVVLGQARLGPYVVDANGLKVGHAQDAGNILMFIDGNPTIISAGPSGFNASPFTLYFTDGACGTQGLLDVGMTGQFYAAGQYTTDGMVYYANAATVAGATIQSAITVNTDGSLGACGPMFTSILGSPVLAGLATGGTPTLFTTPFSVVDTLPVSPAPATATFNDVPTSHPFFQFIEALHASGITGGCQAAPPLYCPDNPVTRGQMAVFLAKALGL